MLKKIRQLHIDNQTTNDNDILCLFQEHGRCMLRVSGAKSENAFQVDAKKTDICFILLY